MSWRDGDVVHTCGHYVEDHSLEPHPVTGRKRLACPPVQVTP